jgi:hypothetical protein
MKKTPIFLALVSLLISGCVHYADQETPPGSVPPPPTNVPRPVPAYQQPSNPAQSNGANNSAPSESTVGEFAKAYTAKQSPKIAVYLNRELSADVREWHVPARLIVEGKMKIDRAGVQVAEDTQATSSGARRVSQVAGGESTVKGKDGKFYEQIRLSDDRTAPPEAWVWQFEQSYFSPFLNAKTFLLDRATILRLTAGENAAVSDSAVREKQLEISALKGKADLLMEILIHRNSSSPVGYEFKVAVKEVQSGRLLSSVSSLTWKQERLRRVSGGRVIATKDGYQVTDDPFPKLDRVATELAHDVMRSLMAIWSGA